MDKLDAFTDTVAICALAAIAILTSLDPSSIVTAVIALAGVRAGKQGGGSS